MVSEEGVSPVIATILMVAITVVLAATLYVMVSTNMLGGTATTAKVTGSLTEIPRSSFARSVNFTITMTIPEKAACSNVRIVVVLNNTVTALKYDGEKGIWTNATSGGKWHFEARLDDLDGNGEFSDGDKLCVCIVDDNPADSTIPPVFHTGDQVLFSIVGYHGTASGVIQL